MKRLILGALVGGALGATVSFVRSDTETETTAGPTSEPYSTSGGRSTMVTAALAGAAAGALVGLLLDRRAKRASGALVDYARTARPKVESATQTAVEKLFEAAEFALPVVEHAAVVARSRAADFADTAKDKTLTVVH